MMDTQPLSRDFYEREPVAVARDLLGKTLIRRQGRSLCGGVIVEVEAYLGRTDSASHSYRGQTPRNRSMFGPAGHLYVYAIHARHCMNVVTQEEGVPTAVLIRAIEPLWGINQMQRRRGGSVPRDIARGPARLCEALAVDRQLDGWDLTCQRKLWISSDGIGEPSYADGFGPPLKADGFGPPSKADRARSVGPLRIAASPRIGVTSAKDEMLRFFIDGSPFVSGPRKHHSRPRSH